MPSVGCAEFLQDSVCYFRGRMPKIMWRWTAAAISSSVALLLFVSVMTYSSFTSSGSPVFQEMMNRFMVDFTSNTVSQRLGGGVLGTLLLFMYVFPCFTMGNVFNRILIISM